MLSVKCSDWHLSAKEWVCRGVGSLFVLCCWLTVLYFWNLLIYQINLLFLRQTQLIPHPSSPEQRILLSQSLLDLVVFIVTDHLSPGWRRTQSWVHLSISLDIVATMEHRTVSSSFLFVGALFPSVFSFTYHRWQLRCGPSEWHPLLQWTLLGQFPAVTSGVIWLFSSQPVGILQPLGPVTCLFNLTFPSSQTLHSSHFRYLVHSLLK